VGSVVRRGTLLGWLMIRAMLPDGAAAQTGWLEHGLALEATPAALHGTLVVPAGARDVAGVLLLAGSGPVDRDGNFPGGVNNCLRLLAHGLADRGIASLRVDKRGVAASRAAGPHEDALRFETYVDDAARWLELLQAQPGIGRVFVLGVSEGALVGTLASERIRPAGLILVAGAGAPAGAVMRRQLAEAGLAPPLLRAAEQAIAALERGETVADPPPALAALLRPSVQPYVRSWLAYDPVAELAKLRAPALVVQGGNDLQVSEADARRLAGAGPAIELRLIVSMNHVLKSAPRDRAANLASYADPQRPLARQLVPAIADFIVRH